MELTETAKQREDSSFLKERAILKTIWGLLIVWMGRCELPCVSQPSLRRGPTEVLISLTLDWWCLLSMQGCREGLLTSNGRHRLTNPSCFPQTRQGASMIKSVKDCREKFVSLSQGELPMQKLRSSVARFLLAA